MLWSVQSSVGKHVFPDFSTTLTTIYKLYMRCTERTSGQLYIGFVTNYMFTATGWQVNVINFNNTKVKLYKNPTLIHST